MGIFPRDGVSGPESSCGDWEGMAEFRVGIDSYCLNPRKMDPFRILEWVETAGGEGVQFSEIHLPPGRQADQGFLEELARDATGRGMYLEWGGGEHVPFDTSTWKPKDIVPGNRRAAREAHTLGATIVRSCSGGFFRWADHAPPTHTLLEAMAGALRPQASFFRDLGVTLALELHFEFTTFELVRLFEMCQAEPGDWLGICLDTFNVLPMLEDPVLASDRVLPWVVATHIKDGGMALEDEGLLTFPTAVGEGQVDFHGILALLATLPGSVNLSVEDHGGRFRSPFFNDDFRVRFPDLDTRELSRLVAGAHKGDAALQAGEMFITDRAKWPELCEERTRQGLRNLRRIVTDFQDRRAGGGP
jgi:sugar phosphate isomerase/epimerase